MRKEAKKKRIEAIDHEIQGRLYDVIGYSAVSNMVKIDKLRKEKRKLMYPWYQRWFGETND